MPTAAARSRHFAAGSGPRSPSSPPSGPAHLERFGTLDRTLAAKAEITSRARVVVLNTDDERLDGLAKRLDAGHKVVRASGMRPERRRSCAGAGRWPRAASLRKLVRRRRPCTGYPSAHPNECRMCGCGGARARRSIPEAVAEAPRLLARRAESAAALPGQRRVMSCSMTPSTPTRPAPGHALDALASQACEGRRVLVTPGMVELGRAQRDENAALAERAADVLSPTSSSSEGPTGQRSSRAAAERVRPLPVKLVDHARRGGGWARAAARSRRRRAVRERPSGSLPLSAMFRGDEAAGGRWPGRRSLESGIKWPHDEAGARSAVGLDDRGAFVLPKAALSPVPARRVSLSAGARPARRA